MVAELKTIMCSMKLPPEPSSCGNYQLWRKDIDVWAKLTETPSAKRGLALQYACRTNERLHEAIINIPSAEVECEEGLQNVLKVLDTYHKVDKKEIAIKSYKDFLALKRKSNQTISEFILEFDAVANKTKTNGNTLSDDLMAYQLLQAVNISETDERIIKASTTELSYKNVQDSLKRSFGDNTYDTQNIKPEPVYVNKAYDDNSSDTEDEVFFGASSKWKNFRKNKTEPTVYQLSMKQTFRRGKNPLDNNGQITQCNYCCSINHYAGECPDKRKESHKNNQAYYNVTLYEQDEEDPDNMKSLIHETFGCAVLDCGAPRTVCGENWLNNYLATLHENEYELVKYSKSSSVFKFGNGKCIKASNLVCLPITIGTQNVILNTDVVTEDIPLLFSRNSMKRAKAKLNTADDTISMLGEEINLIITSTGHYAVPISRNKAILEQEANINLISTLPNMSHDQIALKLHRQFAHPSPERLIKLIENSNYRNQKLNEKILEISADCDVCKKYKKRSPRPVVGMPLATQFNEVVAMDIKFIEGQPILHMIDCLTRYSASAIVPNKKPESIISTIFKNWISIFGPPHTFLSDNGGEFINEEFISLGEAYNIRLRTTAAESPWSNGICERYNGIIGEMVKKIMEDTKCSLIVALAWANSAKNTMQTIHGFSPAQLVFGYNPMLPCVMTDKPPALSSENDYAEIVERNLKAQRSARIAHVQSESSERVRRALNKNIRTSGDIKYVNGDSVYFRKNKENKWKGPASVIGQDGQLVLVKLQSSWYRVHPCNLQLIPEKKSLEVQESTKKDENTKSKEKINFEGCDTQRNQSIEESDDDQEIINNEIPLIDPNLNIDRNNTIPVQNVENNDRPTEYQVREGEEIIHEEESTDQVETINENLNQTNSEDTEDHTEIINNEGRIEQIDTTNENLDHTNTNNIDRVEETPLTNKTKNVLKFKNKLFKGNNIRYKPYDQENWETGKIHSRSGKVKGKYSNEWNVEVDGEIRWIDFDRMIERVEEVESTDDSDDTNDETLLTQVFFNQYNEKVAQAKKRELNSWIDKQVYEEVENEGQNLMGLKWVIKPKIIDGKDDIKARLVCKGNLECETFRKDSPTYSKPAIRLCSVLISSHRWNLESLDVKCAFLQSDHIERDIYVKPPKESKTNKIWHLKKTPYGLKDASRVWFLKLEKALTDLGCKALTAELSVFYWRNDEGLQGIILVYVDDMMHGGTSEFQKKIIIPLQSAITIGAKHDQAFSYIGLNVFQLDDKSICLDQNHYLSNLKPIDEIKSSSKNYQPGEEITDEIEQKMRKVIGKLNWLTTMSRPDIAFHTCYMSTLMNKATQRDIVKLNKVVKFAKNNPLRLVFSPLCIEKIQLRVYTDAAHGNLHDGGSQGGYVIFATDGDKTAIVDWSSHRLTRVAGNTLTAETLALTDGVDAAITYRFTLSELLGVKIPPVIAFTDCKSLYDNIGTSHIVTEKRLRIELAALREHVKKGELSLEWINSKSQIADALTKEGASAELLRKVIEEGLVEW